MSAESYSKKLNRILEYYHSDGIKLEFESSDDGIKIGEILFRTNNNPQNATRNEGVLLSNSSEELRSILRSKGISYLESRGHIYIRTKHGYLELNPKEMKAIKKHDGMKVGDVEIPNPTNLISPIGLSIIDTLFRLSKERISDYGSVLKFCNEYNIPQPKMSLTMKRLNAKSIIELKDKIKQVPIEWWFYAFESPNTKRNLVNFFEIAVPHYSLLETEIESEQVLKEIDTIFPMSAPGPTEVAKKFKTLIDQDLSLWISVKNEAELKKRMKLVPGRKIGKKTWMIAAISDEVLKEAVIAHDYKTQVVIKTNIMRSIWDLGHGDSRLREVRMQILKVFLNET